MKNKLNNGASTARYYQSGIVTQRDNLKANTANPSVQNSNHFPKNSWMNAGTGTSYGTTAAHSNSNRSNHKDLFLSDRYNFKVKNKDREYYADMSLSC